MLNVVSFDEAVKIIDDLPLMHSKSEMVLLRDALGRVVSENIISKENVPSFDRSTVDGYAVRASDTFGAGESIPALLSVKGVILMGKNADFFIEGGECVKISTGGMLPEGADSVVMVENTENENNGLCLVFKAVSPFENVTKCGDDTKANQVIIPKGTIIDSRHIGILAAMGYDRVQVISKPAVAVISTGDEVVEITQLPSAGQVRDVNTHLLCSMLEEYGCRAVPFGILRDNRNDIFKTVKKASEEYDAVLVSGGSSAGTRDMTVDIITQLGEVYAHGVAMKPGKPTIIGSVNGKPVFGLPGHPAAAFFVTLTLVAPLLIKMSRKNIKDLTEVYPINSNISSNHGREEFLCVKIENGKAVPAYAKSGIISMLTKADGYIVIDRNAEGIKMGENVTVHLFRGNYETQLSE